MNPRMRAIYLIPGRHFQGPEAEIVTYLKEGYRRLGSPAQASRTVAENKQILPCIVKAEVLESHGHSSPCDVVWSHAGPVREFYTAGVVQGCPQL